MSWLRLGSFLLEDLWDQSRLEAKLARKHGPAPLEGMGHVALLDLLGVIVPLMDADMYLPSKKPPAI